MYASGVFVSAFLALAQVVRGHPADTNAVVARDELGDIVEHTVFKRGDVLTPEDLQFAKRNQIDINEMYKHSVFKRSSGEDYFIWVHNSYNESYHAAPADTTPASETDAESRDQADGAIEARQEQKHRLGSLTWSFGYPNSQCSASYYWVSYGTNANSPYTGGAHAIIAWCDRNNFGAFVFPEGCCRHPVRPNLIIGGTNSGANARFSAGFAQGEPVSSAVMGIADVRKLTYWARRDGQREINGWRFQAEGRIRCGWVRPDGTGPPMIAYTLDRSSIVL